ncbi:MAG TPA: FecR domain-containing protein [Ramlibacter sp.]|nr:FecR domain-containing protein [Ramlibacter sp.]
MSRTHMHHTTTATASFSRRLRMLHAWLALMALMALALLWASPVHAQSRAGEVSHLQGMATAQQPGGAFRFLGKGDPVMEGDTLTTTDKGYAVVTLGDGTKFTMRPGTSFAVERFAHDAGAESALMRLFKGGVRVVTGLVGKRNPGGVELRTTTATLGIRGTSFDARLCGADCRAENNAPVTPGTAAIAPPEPVVARVVQVSGQATALTRGKAPRPLVEGGSLFEGDDVRTGPGATVVLGFRDQSKVSINPDTVLRITAFIYNRPQTGNAINLGLLRGGIRAVTGLIGKATPDAVKITTPTAAVGIRGTGMDISCDGPCADPELGPPPAPPPAGGPASPLDGLYVLTWEGGTYFARAVTMDIPLERVGFIGADGEARLLTEVPAFFASFFVAPRPDGIQVNWENLFAAINPTGSDGLYVYVRDGHVYIQSLGSRIDLGAGEAGYAGEPGTVRRIEPAPRFLTLDPFPLPEQFSQGAGDLLQLFGITLGQPGQEICRL